MTDKQRSDRAKAIWQKFTPEQRSARMSIVAKSKNSQMTKEQRSAHAAMMSKARWSKKKEV